MTTHVPTKAVVFDLDGTLLDTMGSAPRAYADTISSLGGPTVTPDDVVAAWHLGPTPVVLAHFLGRPSAPEDVEHFYLRFETAVDGVAPFPGVTEMLDGLEDYRLGLFTAATRRAAEPLLAATGLASYFHTTLCGDEVDDPKPAAEGLELTCRKLDVRPEASAYVGDTANDMRCARNAGAIGIHAVWGGTPVIADETRLVARHPRDVITLLERRTR